VTWTTRASCAGKAELFDAAADGRSAASRVAVAFCAVCPVRRECLDDALALEDGPYVYGVRAGLSGHERLRLRQVAAD